jgi:2'-5' RNA ligase
VAGHAAFSLPTGGLGAFPRPQYARVVWYGVGDDGRLAELARSIREALRVEDGVFRAHITLARLPAGESLDAWLAAQAAPDGNLAVREVTLVRSHVASGPPTHETIGIAQLGHGC